MVQHWLRVVFWKLSAHSLLGHSSSQLPWSVPHTDIHVGFSSLLRTLTKSIVQRHVQLLLPHRRSLHPTTQIYSELLVAMPASNLCKQAVTSCSDLHRNHGVFHVQQCGTLLARNARWSQVDHAPIAVTLGCSCQWQRTLDRASWRRWSNSRSTHFRRLPWRLEPKIGEKADSKMPGTSLVWVFNFPDRLKTSGKMHAHFPGKSVWRERDWLSQQFGCWR